MMINEEVLDKLNLPRKSYKFHLSHYAGKSFTLKEFIEIDKTSHYFQISVLVRLLNDQNLNLFALDCCQRAPTKRHILETAAHAAVAKFGVLSLGQKREKQRRLGLLISMIDSQ